MEYRVESVTIAILLHFGTVQMEGGIENLYADCPDGYFGYKCSFRCHCANSEICNKRTGACVTCAPGFWGPGCQLSYNCYYNGQKKLYLGTMSKTESGFTCQMWAQTSPHKHEYKPEDFPDRRYPENYCRNTVDATRPWCYTTDPAKRWDYCNVHNCDCVDGRFGQNCAKECHCQPDRARESLDNGATCDSILGMCRRAGECGIGWRDFGCQTATRCARNRYGWDCSRQCHCLNPSDCDRFSGPKPSCRCEKGYFSPPHCKPVTEPAVLRFSNVKVNPGQPTLFNCTISSVPAPQSRDVKVVLEPGHALTLVQSNVPIYKIQYTLINLFRAVSVYGGAKYTCIVRSVAGTARKTIRARVYNLPSLSKPPKVTEINAKNVTLSWNPWTKGDSGDPPIIRYSVWYKKSRERSYRMAGTLYHSFCGAICRYTVTKLYPHTQYMMHVVTRREGKGGNGPPGKTVKVKTACGVPSQPVSITHYSSVLVTNFTDITATFSLTWQDPPVETLHCNEITHYFIYLKRGGGGGKADMITRRGVDGQRYTVGGLEPFRQYCVRIRLQTDARLTSPFSQRRCLTTPEALPTSPQNIRVVKEYSDSVVIAWERPRPARGNITRYRVIYWDWESGESQHVVESTAKTVEYLLPGLEPYKEYHAQVLAISGAGPGKPGKTLKFQTSEGSPVVWVRNTTRTGTSISLEWRSPGNDRGRIKYFTVSCTPLTSISDAADLDPHTVSETVQPSLTRYTVVGLEPAVRYACSVNASTRFGSGPKKTVFVWTKAVEPDVPEKPRVISTSHHTVTVDLRASHDKLISFYRLIVEKIEQDKPRLSKRRATPDLGDINNDVHTARDSLFYVTAQLEENDASGPFTVGDNNTYGGYYNAPLERRRSYNIWFGVYSNVDGVLSTSFAKTIDPVVTMENVHEERAGSPVAIIVGVLVGFILLIIIFAIVLYLWRRRAIQTESGKEDISTFISVPQPTFLPESDGSLPHTPIEPRENIEFQPLLQQINIKGELEPIYGNVLSSVEPIRVEDLWDYIRKQKENDMEGLKDEFKLIPAGLTAKHDVAKRLSNKSKNRYGNIIAYDHSRVVLQPVEGDPFSDYINANYIDGYRKRAAYIAAQGPTKTTLADIWRMTWQENCKTVIMLTNPTETGRKKCDQYWPEEGCGNYDNISVQMTTCDVLPDFTIRTFLLTKGDESKLVKQFHYTAWPDHGVPKFGNSLILFRQKIRAYDPLLNGPPIVHCSAGVGRTGTYIALDTQLERARHEGIIDVHNFVQLMRMQRVNMVQTLEQYVYVYDVLLEALISGETTSSLIDFRDVYRQLCLPQPGVGRSKLEEQFEILCLISTTLFKCESSAALDAENLHKNRSKTILPANRCRPYLTSLSEDGNDYINAVFVNSYLKRDAFILTQMPLPHTLRDFWRLVYDHNCYTIVMLNDITLSDETCRLYWPNGEGVERYGSFLVETTAENRSNPSVTVRNLTLTNTSKTGERARCLRQFQLHRWVAGSDVPSSKTSLRELMQLVLGWHEESRVQQPVLIHCMDGCTRSGVLCAAFSILERIQSDLEVDVFQTVKSLRINRPQAVATIEQYRFLHDLSLDFLTSATTDSLLVFASPAGLA